MFKVKKFEHNSFVMLTLQTYLQILKDAFIKIIRLRNIQNDNRRNDD